MKAFYQPLKKANILWVSLIVDSVFKSAFDYNIHDCTTVTYFILFLNVLMQDHIEGDTGVSAI